MKKSENAYRNGGCQITVWFGINPWFEYQRVITGTHRTRSSKRTKPSATPRPDFADQSSDRPGPSKTADRPRTRRTGRPANGRAAVVLGAASASGAGRVGSAGSAARSAATTSTAAAERPSAAED